jgi:transposase-like protein
MAMCIYHNGTFGNESVCPRCKSCKHTSWFRKEGNPTYQCENCPKTSEKPTGEKWLLTKDGEWREE